MKSIPTNPKSAAFLGFLFVLPFLVMNFIIALRLEPVYAWIGSFPAIRNSAMTPLLLLLLLPIGAYIASLPVLRKEAEGKRRLFPANIVVALFLLVIFAVLFTGLGEDLYRCEVLKIPYCD